MSTNWITLSNDHCQARGIYDHSMAAQKLRNMICKSNLIKCTRTFHNLVTSEGAVVGWLNRISMQIHANKLLKSWHEQYDICGAILQYHYRFIYGIVIMITSWRGYSFRITCPLFGTRSAVLTAESHWQKATDTAHRHFPWLRHQMETFSVLLALCVGNSPVTGEFPSQRPVICAWINGWLNNREAGDLRRHRAHYDVTVMFCYRPEEAVSQLFQSFETTHWLSFDVTAMKFETQNKAKRQNSQIPQCIRPIPHNAPFRTEMCTLLRPGENVRHFPDDDKKKTFPGQKTIYFVSFFTEMYLFLLV